MANPTKQENKTSRSEPTAAAPPPVAPGSSSSRFFSWFISKTVRHASAMRKHVQKILDHQRDILQAPAIAGVESALRDTDRALAERPNDRAALEKQMQNLEEAANKWLKPYPNAAWRENVEVLLVALAVAMAIRTFFLQPFKIPTGSMQPTLFGVTSDNLIQQQDFKIPTGWERVREWFAGTSYVHVVAKNDGNLTRVDQPVRFLIFNLKQTLWVGETAHTIWFPPDYGAPPGGTLEVRAGLQIGQPFHAGDDVVRLKVNAGDHLFVDRVTYNFRPPTRGEIIVFETRGIESLPQDQFYIKRLVALGSEQVKIGDDRHLVINGKRLDSSTPHFEKVYSFGPNDPPRESHYSGHVDGPFLAPYFHGKPEGVTIPPDHYMVMGDNTVNSLDSRYWGPFPAGNVIGKSFFVYWPITDRFGWGYHR